MKNGGKNKSVAFIILVSVADKTTPLRDMQKQADIAVCLCFNIHRHTSYPLLIYPSIRLCVLRDILVIL